ncbi:hypothetical protein ABE28_009705 [Peribacillus muralis]|uniref:Hydantoinase n=1 Tax=Peribacillus muralis TaxID=264697 RepID=A0A1B3XN31_9BACI|nr:hydantoinase/oxoprolinase family protein [Peribacillus muralis]AOH54624.1 hypothetical protein ABE28_009705 [Peribacillus muralis]
MSTAATVRIGIDTGGTFTDCVLLHDGHPAVVFKVPSTPENPAKAILQGLERLCIGAGIPLEEIDFIAHGTTVATNAMLQEQWAKVGLITTKGFRDILEIGTQMRPELYGLHQKKPAPLVTRDLREEVTERIDADGQVVDSLDEDEVRDIVRKLLSSDIDSLAITLLFSFANPKHEAAIRAIVKEMAPELYVCISSEVSPEFREYPRTSTTVINGALAPIIRRYLRHLREALNERGAGQRLHIMQSNGGNVSAEEAEGSAHNLILSGPAGGIVAAAEIARKAGYPNALTFDMGGTSSDVGLIVNGRAQIIQNTTVNGAYPLQVPTVDVHTIGAGGGSIGWCDQGGALKVGPKSAGAVPGPACYGKGGTEPTVTDANLFLGRLNADYYLGGEFDVYPERSDAVLEELANDMELELERLAWGIIEVANASMVGALRVVSSRRGHDPRDFALIAFGGAGPLHATALAKELGVRKVIVPATPGVLCALGLLLSDIRHDFSQTEVSAMANVDEHTTEQSFREMEGRGISRLVNDGVTPNHMRLERSLDIRYLGQEHYLNVPIEGEITSELLEESGKRFHSEHENTYGHAAEDEPIEIVNLRLSAVGKLKHSEQGSMYHEESTTGQPLPSDKRSVYFSGQGWCDTPIYRRKSLVQGYTIVGPAIIEQMDTTLIVEPGQWVESDQHGNMIVTLGDFV